MQYLLAIIVILGFTGTVKCDFDEVLRKFSNVETAKEHAEAWLTRRRQPDWGWDSDTSRVVNALILANDEWLEPTVLENQLSLKQLDIDLLLELWSQNHQNPLRAGRLAQFINSLVGTCRDPRSFYGHDLVGTLEHLESQHPFEFSYTILALCNAGAHIRKKQIRHLMSIAQTLDEEHLHDTTAMLVMALTCVTKERHNKNLMTIMHHPIKKLKKSQKDDGSFGNIHTSAIVTQALLPLSDGDGSWNATSALQYILSQQKEDGSFGNQLATTSVLPILAGRSYIHLTNTSCRIYDSQLTTGSETVTPSLVPPVERQMISVNYSLWIGTNVTESHTINVTVPANTSFYEIMKVSAEMDSKFEFSANLWPNGHYVHTINSIRENTTLNQYWLLAVWNDPAQKPIFVDSGVDDFFPKNGDHIIFWYKKI